MTCFPESDSLHKCSSNREFVDQKERERERGKKRERERERESGASRFHVNFIRYGIRDFIAA